MAFASQKDLQNSVLSWPLAIPVDHTLVLPAFSFIGSQCSWNSRTHPFSTRLIKTWNKSRAWLPNGVCTTTQNYFLVGGPHCVLKTMPLPQPLQTPFRLSISLVTPSAKQPRSRGGTPLVSPSMRLWCQLWNSLNPEDPRFRHIWEETSPWAMTVVSLVIGRGLERLSYQLTLLFHISVFLSMSVSTRKLPHIFGC